VPGRGRRTGGPVSGGRPRRGRGRRPAACPSSSPTSVQCSISSSSSSFTTMRGRYSRTPVTRRADTRLRLVTASLPTPRVAEVPQTGRRRCNAIGGASGAPAASGWGASAGCPTNWRGQKENGTADVPIQRPTMYVPVNPPSSPSALIIPMDEAPGRSAPAWSGLGWCVLSSCRSRVRDGPGIGEPGETRRPERRPGIWGLGQPVGNEP